MQSAPWGIEETTYVIPDVKINDGVFVKNTYATDRGEVTAGWVRFRPETSIPAHPQIT